MTVSRRKYVVMATGCLSAQQVPQIAGLETFQGDWYHTGSWPHEGVDFSGKPVGVVGTGSSGIQAIPVIAGQARHLYVFQRTPNFSLPARNGPLRPGGSVRLKARYVEYRQEIRYSRGGSGVSGADAIGAGGHARGTRDAPTKHPGRAAASPSARPSPR